MAAAETEVESFSQGDGTHWLPVTYMTKAALYGEGRSLDDPDLTGYLLKGLVDHEKREFVRERAIDYTVGTGQLALNPSFPDYEVVVLFAQLNERDTTEYKLTFDTQFVSRTEPEAFT